MDISACIALIQSLRTNLPVGIEIDHEALELDPIVTLCPDMRSGRLTRPDLQHEVNKFRFRQSSWAENGVFVGAVSETFDEVAGHSNGTSK